MQKYAVDIEQLMQWIKDGKIIGYRYNQSSLCSESSGINRELDPIAEELESSSGITGESEPNK